MVVDITFIELLGALTPVYALQIGQIYYSAKTREHLSEVAMTQRLCPNCPHPDMEVT